MMNFKILPFKDVKDNIVFIGRTGVLRIKNKLALKLGLQKTEKWLFAIDQNDNFNKSIYLLKARNEYNLNGKQIAIINGSWSIDAKPVIREFILKTPISFKVELFNEGNYDGLRLVAV